MLVLVIASLAAWILATPSSLQLAREAPPDSVAARLHAAETAGGSREGAEAALMLGRFYYARGEYRSAAAALSRAAARLDPARKSEALYWAGLSRLALREPNPARAALEEVAASPSPRRPDALLGIATAWDLLDRPDRAFDTLEGLLSEPAGEAGPAALERYAALAVRFDRPDVAKRARARLLAEYPQSMEAAAAAAAAEAPVQGAEPRGPVQLESGAFASTGRARALAGRAVEAGFVDARVSSREDGGVRSYVVILGTYPNESEARKAQARAAERLGVTSRLAGERP